MGEANPDSWQYNPYQTKKQRAETEVRMLLEKCQPETIALDPDILAKLDQNRIEGKQFCELLLMTFAAEGHKIAVFYYLES